MNTFISNKKLTMVELQNINGGYSKKQCIKDIVGWTATGTLGGGVAGMGVGTIPGAFVGAHLGAIAGSAVCIGGIIGR